MACRLKAKHALQSNSGTAVAKASQCKDNLIPREWQSKHTTPWVTGVQGSIDL